MIGRNNTVLLLMFAAIDRQPQAGPSGDYISQNLREESPVSRSATLRVCSETISGILIVIREAGTCFDQVPQSQLVTSYAASNSTAFDQNVLLSTGRVAFTLSFTLWTLRRKETYVAARPCVRACKEARSQTSEPRFSTVFLPKY